jgi:hypothetical protein
MAAISSGQLMARPVSASTRAAASKAVSGFVCVVRSRAAAASGGMPPSGDGERTVGGGPEAPATGNSAVSAAADAPAATVSTGAAVEGAAWALRDFLTGSVETRDAAFFLAAMKHLLHFPSQA